MEDHVAMSGVAARQVLEVGELVIRIVASELVCAVKALDSAGSRDASTATSGLYARAREVMGPAGSDSSLDVGPVVRIVRGMSGVQVRPAVISEPPFTPSR